jgi:hypothetical protein
MHKKWKSKSSFQGAKCLTELFQSLNFQARFERLKNARKYKSKSFQGAKCLTELFQSLNFRARFEKFSIQSPPLSTLLTLTLCQLGIA